MERDSMVFYRSFMDSILKLEQQFDADTAMQLFKVIAHYGIDGVQDEMSPIIDLMFTTIKPQIDANTKRFVDGKKGGRPKKTSGKATTKPVVSKKITSGYESNKPVVIDDENQWLSKSKPNVNVNDNVNVNENENVFKGKNKNFDFNREKLLNIHNHIFDIHKLDAKKLLRNDGHLYKAFLKWLVYMNVDINVVSKVEMNLKKFTNEIKKLYTTDSIIAAAEHAMLENHKSIHPKEKLPNHENRERLSDFLKK